MGNGVNLTGEQHWTREKARKTRREPDRTITRTTDCDAPFRERVYAPCSGATLLVPNISKDTGIAWNVPLG